ncbi:MAG: hypothetical protein K2M76_08170, partial [Muribaculaceae bacterium]|nr:hypothetical protein [Muribaculaceae bacterium]
IYRLLSVFFAFCFINTASGGYYYDGWNTIPTDSLYAVKGQPTKISVNYFGGGGNVDRTMWLDAQSKPLVEIWETTHSYTPDTLLYSSNGRVIAYFSHDKSGKINGSLPDFAHKSRIKPSELYISPEQIDKNDNWLWGHAASFGQIKRDIDYNSDETSKQLIERFTTMRESYESHGNINGTANNLFGFFPGEMAMTGLGALAVGIILFIILSMLPFRFNYTLSSIAAAAVAGYGLLIYFQSLTYDMSLHRNFLLSATIVIGVALCIFISWCTSKMADDRRYSNSDVQTVGLIWAIFATVVVFYPLLNVFLWSWLAITFCWVPGVAIYMMIVDPLLKDRCPQCHRMHAIYVKEIVDDGQTVTETDVETTSRESKPHHISNNLDGIRFRTTERETTRVKTRTYEHLLVEYSCRHCDYHTSKRKRGDLLKQSDSSLTTTTEKHWREK